MDFFEAAANWGDRRHADVTFLRDRYEGWMAVVHLSDMHGQWSVYVEMMDRKPRETIIDYQDRVAEKMERTVARARSQRILRKTRKNPMAA